MTVCRCSCVMRDNYVPIHIDIMRIVEGGYLTISVTGFDRDPVECLKC